MAAAVQQADDGRSLPELFAEAQQLHESASSGTRRGDDPALLEELERALDVLRAARSRVRAAGVFSRNEELDDINSESLRYFLVDYYLGSLLQRLPRRGRDRLGVLRSAGAALLAFLSACDDYGLVHAGDRGALEGAGVRGGSADGRQAKIDRFKRERAAKARLAELAALAAEAERRGEPLDEELERERTLVAIRAACLQAADDLTAMEQEKELIEMQLAREERVEELPPEPPVAAPGGGQAGPGLQVTHIDETLNLTRETVRGTVFQPDHELPTVTLEQYGAQQAQEAMEREQRQKEAAESGTGASFMRRRQEHLERDGDEDDAEASERATYNDRAWDDWKDMNPRGAGNAEPRERGRVG